MVRSNRMIPEFSEHFGTIAMYPFRTDIWRSDAKYMQQYVLELVEIISRYEPVILICRESDVATLSQRFCKNVDILPLAYDDIWARDIGPTFIEDNGEVRCISWKFNAWGGRKEGSYFPWTQDDSFAEAVANYLGLNCKRVPVVLEGGAVLTDGCGTLFTTRSVLLNRNRNPFKRFEEIDATLKKELYLNNIVWLDQGLARDETNGHIDNLISIIKPGELCIAWTDDKKDMNYKRVRKAYDTILSQYNCVIHKVPLPPPQFMNNNEEYGLEVNDNSITRSAGDLLPASYLNFYFVNGGIILPSFGCEEDDVVLKIFTELFPDRKIEQVYSREPLLGGGGIHCILHEIPKLR